jgi:hypothetical protein
VTKLLEKHYIRFNLTGKNLSYACTVHNGLKQGLLYPDRILLFVKNIPSGRPGIEWPNSGTFLCRLCLMEENMNTVKNNLEILIQAIKEVVWT